MVYKNVYMETMILLVSKNLARYKSEIILLDYQNDFVRHSRMSKFLLKNFDILTISLNHSSKHFYKHVTYRYIYS